MAQDHTSNQFSSEFGCGRSWDFGLHQGWCCRTVCPAEIQRALFVWIWYLVWWPQRVGCDGKCWAMVELPVEPAKPCPCRKKKDWFTSCKSACPWQSGQPARCIAGLGRCWGGRIFSPNFHIIRFHIKFILISSWDSATLRWKLGWATTMWTWAMPRVSVRSLWCSYLISSHRTSPRLQKSLLRKNWRSPRKPKTKTRTRRPSLYSPIMLGSNPAGCHHKWQPAALLSSKRGPNSNLAGSQKTWQPAGLLPMRSSPLSDRLQQLPSAPSLTCKSWWIVVDWRLLGGWGPKQPS